MSNQSGIIETVVSEIIWIVLGVPDDDMVN